MRACRSFTHNARIKTCWNHKESSEPFKIKVECPARHETSLNVGAVGVEAVTETTVARSAGSGVDWDIFSAEPDDVILLPHLQG